VSRGYGVVEGLGPSPEKVIFCPQNDSFGCILTQFITDRSLRTRILQFNRIMKLTKTVQKLSKNSRSDQRAGGRGLHNRPEYALNLTFACIRLTDCIQVGVKVLIMADKFKSQDYNAMIGQICPELEQSTAETVSCKSSVKLTCRTAL